jgi:Fungal protein kinase
MYAALKNLALDLLIALQSFPLSRHLHSSDRCGTLLRDLARLITSVDDTDKFDIKSLLPLLNKVIGNASDEAIFNTSENRKHFDGALRDELDSSLYIDVPDFFDAFFGEVTNLSSVADTVFRTCQGGKDPLYTEEGGWRDWPKDAKEDQVLKWLKELVDKLLHFAKGSEPVPNIRRRPLAQPSQPLLGSTTHRKLDVGFVNDTRNTNRVLYNWSQILVLGELKSNPNADRHTSTWLDLASYAREVLTAQDARLFPFLGEQRKSNKAERSSNPPPASLATLPLDVKLIIASLCPYSTVISLEKSCRAFRGLLHHLPLVRDIAETVYHNSRFNNAGTWSAIHLDLQHAKSICAAVEMTIKSAEKSVAPLTDFLRSGIVLAVHSHPLTGVMDLNALQFCLPVARYYKLDDAIPDIAFCLVAAILERGVLLENHFSTLKSVVPQRSESLIVIAFLVMHIHSESLKDIQEVLPRPRLSLIPFEALLGETPSLLSGRDSMKHFDGHLQSLVTSTFLDCQWVGVYLRNWDILYVFNSVQSITRNDRNCLNVSAAINQQALDIESKDFVMTPFGLVVFWEGVSWFWKMEWCDDNFSSVRHLHDGGHKLDLVVS